MGICGSKPDKANAYSAGAEAEVNALKQENAELKKKLEAAESAAKEHKEHKAGPSPPAVAEVKAVAAVAPAAPAAPATAGKGTVDILFFPDGKLPCRSLGKPGGCKRPNCEYAHEATSLTKFLGYLGSAKSTLDVCVFTITNDSISDPILELHGKGIKVRVITDNDQVESTGSDIHKFKEAGIEVRQDSTPAHMHHKFAIIDADLLLNGSFNWTKQAVTSNNENVVVSADAGLIQKFKAQFEQLWAQFTPL